MKQYIFNSILLFAISLSASISFSDDDPNQINEFVNVKNKDFKEYRRSRLTSTKNGKSTYTYAYPDEEIHHEILGSIPNPTTIYHALRTEGEILFNVKNNFDKYSRRVNSEPINNQKEFVLLFGCSYLFGYGAEDHQVVHSYLTRAQNKYYAYNYAVGGTGTNTVLGLLQNRDFQKEIPMKRGHAYYIFIEDHVFRANGFAQQRSWLRNSPFFEKENGKMVYRGSFAKAQPFTTWLFKLLNDDLNITGLLGVNFPKEKDSHFIYTCDLIEGSKQEFHAQYPNGEFTVYIHPLGGQMLPPLLNCLKERKIRILESKIKDSPKYRYEIDGHPTPIANREVAEDIAKDLLLLDQQP